MQVVLYGPDFTLALQAARLCPDWPLALSLASFALLLDEDKGMERVEAAREFSSKAVEIVTGSPSPHSSDASDDHETLVVKSIEATLNGAPDEVESLFFEVFLR